MLLPFLLPLLLLLLLLFSCLLLLLLPCLLLLQLWTTFLAAQHPWGLDLLLTALRRQQHLPSTLSWTPLILLL